MQKIKKFLINTLTFIFVFSVLVAPGISSAQLKSLIPCSGTTTKGAEAVTEAGVCDFNALMKLVDTVIKFILYKMVLPISAIMFAYAGFLLVTAQGGEAKGKAKSIFTNVVLGLVIALAAFLIVRLILAILGYQGTWIGFLPFT